MDEERVRSADEERDADAAEPEDLAALPAADQAQTEAPSESEGLADWLEKVRRSAPGLLVGEPPMRTAAPPRVPESAPPEEAPEVPSLDTTTLQESPAPPAGDVSSVSPSDAPTGDVEASPTRVPSAAAIPETAPTSQVERTPAFAPTEKRLRDAAEEAEAATRSQQGPSATGPAEAAPAEVEQSDAQQQQSLVDQPTLPVESPTDQRPPTREAWPVAARRSTAMATDDIPNDELAPAEPRRWPEATNERRIGDLEPTEHQQPLDFESRGVRVAVPQPQAITPLAPTVIWPQDLPAPSAGAPALVVTDAPQRTIQPSELSPRAEWVSPWPTLPDSFAADDESADPVTALRARDRWTRLVREQESA